MAPLLHREITERILNSFYGVYDEHGYGFAEGVYSRSLVVELSSRGLKVAREVETIVMYKGVQVGVYRADLIVEGKVLVEVKTIETLSPADERQVLNYLKSTRLEVGLLLNFGPRPTFRRLVLSRPT
jgi:GxxExxY protein